MQTYRIDGKHNSLKAFTLNRPLNLNQSGQFAFVFKFDLIQKNIECMLKSGRTKGSVQLMCLRWETVLHCWSSTGDVCEKTLGQGSLTVYTVKANVNRCAEQCSQCGRGAIVNSQLEDSTVNTVKGIRSAQRGEGGREGGREREGGRA